MSNKSTPVRQRIQQFQTRGSHKSTPASEISGLRKKVLMTRTEDHRDQLLNTAFNGGNTTPQPKPKPTSLNACYTPSSLYRNANNTPGRTKTPGTGKSSCSRPKDRDSMMDSCLSVSEESNMIVAVRVRPLNALECTRGQVTNVVQVHGNSKELTVQAGSSADSSAGVTHFFSYDQVYYSCDPERKNYACQAKVFEGTARPLIDTAFEGYNACLFAYGQTGSGKSYSMMGIEALDDAALDGGPPHDEAGIIPRFCHELFRRIEAVKRTQQLQVEVEVSYFEIYNEKIHDLLSVQHAAAASGESTPVQQQHHQQQQRPALKVREHPIFGPYVVDLSAHSVDSYSALRNWLAVGNSQRATASTAMNDKSSRSHSIFNIVLNLTDLSSDDALSSDTDSGSTSSLRQTRRSKISLVDLAGSERISVSGSNGERIREGVSINKSLLTLGKVIAALADSRKASGNGPLGSGTPSTFVPYRESVLTWLLRENLGGNSKTVMLATISPASLHADETLATLRYACKARSIVNRVKVNESPHDKIIRDLRAEVDRLKSLRNEYERQRRLSGNNNNPVPRKIIIETSVDETEVEALRQQLAERERELSRAQKSWMEKLKEAEDQRKSELRVLKRRGLALELTAEQKQACLVNLTADPILSGTLFYLLPQGLVRIGRGRLPGGSANSQPDIVLDGPLVALQHCSIEHERGGKLYVIPGSEDFETYVNGELLQDRRQLFHGDRLVIGGSHYFRISNPFCSQRGKTDHPVDFQLAHQEILQKQEQQLRSELEAEKRAALTRIEQERAQHARDFEERLQCLELEQFKYKCNSEMLETERQALALAQQQEHTPLRQEDGVSTPAQKSTILEDIQRIMLNPSEESLHKTQLMVKEATQRCRQLDLPLEFRQTQTPDEFGLLRTVILILDKQRGLKAEWPTARLGVWLDLVRDSAEQQEKLNARTIFQSVEVNWEPLDADLNETLSDTHNSSRIAINLSAMKDVLLNKPLKRLLNVSSSSNTPRQTSTPSPGSQLMQYTKRLLTYDPEETPGIQSSFTTLVQQELLTMQRSSQRLRRLCENALLERENQQDNGVLAVSLQEALARMDTVLNGMHTSLARAEATASATSPTKTQKAVRFLID
ncbi:kinesin-like protein KIF14 isoform X1 [Drosophila subpulchrella]|uniref:kinesin-like protein KIF14 isoform X1 n=2 Tax=Drosophila subpulchrella TaxID=1486046 RepID=UPI0018A19179|nr:kinesin-like protein KIF14 isoform X1 [Drosophila subpulchrella]